MRAWDRLIAVHDLFHAHFTIQYVPGHVDLEDQEASDLVAKAAAKECAQEGAELPLSVVQAALRSRQREQLREEIPQGHLWRRATDGAM